MISGDSISHQAGFEDWWDHRVPSSPNPQIFKNFWVPGFAE
jgi:hypothetical protein